MFRPPTWRAWSAASAAALVAACSPVEPTSTDRLSASGELIALSGGDAGAANACFTCHGLDGLGDGAGSPRLAVVDVGYLQRQLETYRGGRRRHPQMSWIAKRLSPSDRQAVATYYAALPYAPEQRRGRPPHRLYVAGDPGRGLPSCASCHGVRGEGLGPAYPPLGGQPAAYLAGQMDKWRRSERRNDPGDVMLRISQLLSPSESAAVAAYAARLPGDPPSQESPEAFREEHRGDPRNDASGPPLHVPESARAAE